MLNFYRLSFPCLNSRILVKKINQSALIILEIFRKEKYLKCWESVLDIVENYLVNIKIIGKT